MPNILIISPRIANKIFEEFSLSLFYELIRTLYAQLPLLEFLLDGQKTNSFLVFNLMENLRGFYINSLFWFLYIRKK